MTADDLTPWRCDPSDWPHTPPLGVYMALAAEDDNLFWRMPAGHAQNLLDNALDFIYAVRELADKAPALPVHVGGGNLVDNRRLVSADDLLALVGKHLRGDR